MGRDPVRLRAADQVPAWWTKLQAPDPTRAKIIETH